MTSFEYAKYFLTIFDGLISVIDNALGHPDLVTQLDKGFDAVIIMNTIGGPEIMASYLAEKTNAALIYYSTAQGPGSRISHFVGQPFHPAYMVQTGVVNFESMSSFYDRALNTLVTIFNEAIR